MTTESPLVKSPDQRYRWMASTVGVAVKREPYGAVGSHCVGLTGHSAAETGDQRGLSDTLRYSCNADETGSLPSRVLSLCVEQGEGAVVLWKRQLSFSLRSGGQEQRLVPGCCLMKEIRQGECRRSCQRQHGADTGGATG